MVLIYERRQKGWPGLYHRGSAENYPNVCRLFSVMWFYLNFFNPYVFLALETIKKELLDISDASLVNENEL